MPVRHDAGRKQHQSIRPSLADLSDDGLLQKLQVEARKLQNEANSIHPETMPSLASVRPQVELPKPSIKKSRFAQRQAQLRPTTSPDDDLTVPTGRFSLDLEPDQGDHRTLSGNHHSGLPSPAPLITDIRERQNSSIDPPSHGFGTKFQSNDLPVEPTLSHGPQLQPVIPPWELRRLTSQNSSMKLENTPGGSSHVLAAKASDCFYPSSMTQPLLSAHRQQISFENDSLLSKMSQDEILREQAALKAQLMQSNPALLTQLLVKLKIQPACHDTVPPSSDTFHPTASPPVMQKHVHYAEQVEIVSPKSPPQVEIGTCLSDQHDEKAPDGAHGSPEPVPWRFDWNGVRASEQEYTHASCDDGIHTHQANTFTLKQLLRFTLSSVPSQRMMGFKIMSQIINRYFEGSQSHTKDPAFALLTQELKNSTLDMMMVASQAVHERNVGISTSAIIFLKSIFFQALLGRKSESKHKCTIQPAWIEELLTQTALLADFRSHLHYQDLPRASISLIVQVLRDMVALGDPSKVGEEIVKTSSLLELIVQALIAVPWPVNAKSNVELPDLFAFELILTLAKSSRTCSRSILDRGLLTPMLRFIGLPYWDLAKALDDPSQASFPALSENSIELLIRSMSYQFKLITVFTGYGLGASLRTTLDPLLRPITGKLLKILETATSTPSTLPSRTSHELELVSSYLQLLQGWMRCAEYPHFSDPPHSINWNQVTEWESSVLDFLMFSSTIAYRPPGLNEVLICACDLTALYVKGSFKKNINMDHCLTTLASTMPRLGSALLEAANYLINLPEKHNLRVTSFARLLISLAKLKTRLLPLVSQAPTRFATPHLEYIFPDNAFALACRVAFDFEELSLLPWALWVLDPSHDSKSSLEKILLAGLLVRNSDGIVVGDLLAETFSLCQARVNFECQIVTKHSMQVVAPELSQLSPIFEDYTNQSAYSTAITDPSPFQLQNQISQMEGPAFLLPSTWPLLAITCLTPEHMKSTDTDRQARRGDIMRASYALAIVLQTSMYDMQMRFKSLSDIFHRLFSNRFSVWKAVMTSLIATNSQTLWPRGQHGDNAWSPILGDQVCSQLTIRLIKISARRVPLLDKPDQEESASRPLHKAQGCEDEELYSIFTDILAIYDPASFGNYTFSRILMPFLSMCQPKGFRATLFREYPHVMKNLHVCLEDVLSVTDFGDDTAVGHYELENYFYPPEDDEEMLHIFAEFLVDDSNGINVGDHPFLFIYLIHHLSGQIWNPDRDEQIRIDLLKLVLQKSKKEETCDFILCYDRSLILDDKLNEKIKTRLTSSCFLRIDLDRQQAKTDLKKIKKQERRQWLERIFCTNNGINQVYIDRLRELGWQISDDHMKPTRDTN